MKYGAEVEQPWKGKVHEALPSKLIPGGLYRVSAAVGVPLWFYEVGCPHSPVETLYETAFVMALSADYVAWRSYIYVPCLHGENKRNLLISSKNVSFYAKIELQSE